MMPRGGKYGHYLHIVYGTDCIRWNILQHIVLCTYRLYSSTLQLHVIGICHSVRKYTCIRMYTYVRIHTCSL